MQYDTTINEWHTCPATGRINGSNPCSEYMHLDNSACNLASLNLLRFADEEGTFDVASFRHAVEVVFTAQEIVVGESDYPTAAIGENARAYRQLGLGYANLGALLMARGLAYDSDQGRAWAGAITALMTGWAYRTSARIAEVTGPFAGYAPNADAMLRVMRKHRAAADEIDAELVPEAMLTAAKQAWDEAVALGELHGYRNAQASVLAPTGTIGLMMDCDTTGIEPELALVKTKKLVGGGTMQFVNQTVPARAREARVHAARRSADIVAYIAEHNSVLDAPHLKTEHHTVFDTAMGAQPIHYMGHVRMMARGPAVHLRRHLEDREHARGGHGRRGRAAVPRELEARAEGGRDLPRQLQGRPAAVGGQEEDGRGARAGGAGAAGAQAPAACRARRSPRRSRWATPRATSRPAPTPTTAWARSS